MCRVVKDRRGIRRSRRRRRRRDVSIGDALVEDFSVESSIGSQLVERGRINSDRNMPEEWRRVIIGLSTLVISDLEAPRSSPIAHRSFGRR